MRGGVYCAVCWLAGASLLAAGASRSSAGPTVWGTALQWALLGLVPVFFGLGVYLVLRRFVVA